MFLYIALNRTEMKQKSLKHRNVLQVMKARPKFASKLFIPPQKESSLKNRVQMVPKRRGGV
jgi:hypothetical protein